MVPWEVRKLDSREAFDQIKEYYESQGDRSQETLVAFLRETQEIFGCVPNWSQEEIERVMGIKHTYLQAILKRYSSIRGEAGPCELVICTGPNCSRKGSRQLYQAVKTMCEDHPELESKLTVRTTGCLRQCRTAPNCKLDGVLCQEMTVEKLKENLKGSFE